MVQLHWKNEIRFFILGRLNMSNILWVTVNPPPMLMEEIKAAKADKVSMVLEGV